MRAAAALMALLASAAPAAACDVALSLSFDVSGSMGEDQFRAMREGVAAALLDKEIADSITGADVWVQVWEWAEQQRMIVNWVHVTDRATLETVAAQIANAGRPLVGQSTWLGNALLFAAAQFEAGPTCDRMVLDVAGDGDSNGGVPLPEARASIDPAIQVNGLATNSVAANFYQSNLAQGGGGFVEVTSGYKDFTEALKKKLTRELNLS
jgi:Ca-activated chloride channel family protein